MTETMGAGSAVLDEGVALLAKVLDFVGAGVTVTVAGDKATVSIPGGGTVLAEFHVPLLELAQEISF